tara:strand:- start:845 stop:1027 length:183 start_codon:yes stop_codon:yes gene_type:complete
MKEVVNLIKQKIEENKSLSVTNQEDEQVYILEIACMRECLDFINNYDWDSYDKLKKSVDR